MLELLNKIGQDFLEKEKDKFSFLLVYPRDSLKKTKDGKKKLTVQIFIDLDDAETGVKVDFKEFDTMDIKEFYVLDTQIWEPNDNNWLVSALASKIKTLENSLFGGDFLKAIKKYKIYNTDNEFIKTLERIAKYKLPNGSLIKHITEKIKKKEFEETASIVVVYIRQNGNYIPLSKVAGFKEVIEELNNKHFLERKFFKGISYLSGKETDNLTEPIFIRRVNVNKIFVTTTKNYASYFSDKNYIKNYAIDNQERLHLNAASYYVLNNMVVRIADIEHFILPQVMSRFLESNDIDLLGNIEKFKRSSQLIFEYGALDNLESGLEYEIDADFPIWINYYGYETDGKSLKIINLIKDISPSRLKKIYLIIEELNKKFNFERKLNLYNIYQFIPVRGDRNKRQQNDKVNIALKIFKNILENTPVDKDLIFSLAREAVEAYRYERFEPYVNIPMIRNFDFAVADVIKSYLFLIQILKKLQLMENQNLQNTVPTSQEEEWFNKMGYTDDQKAMFYLGRLLDTIAYAQTKQGHASKPVLNKLNYNGMDKDAIIRLAEDLFEKIRQYARQLSLSFAEYNYAMFNKFFNPNNWKISPQEALFYILSGYSYGRIVNINNEQSETQENN